MTFQKSSTDRHRVCWFSMSFIWTWVFRPVVFWTFLMFGFGLLRSNSKLRIPFRNSWVKPRFFWSLENSLSRLMTLVAGKWHIIRKVIWYVTKLWIFEILCKIFIYFQAAVSVLYFEKKLRIGCVNIRRFVISSHIK